MLLVIKRSVIIFSLMGLSQIASAVEHNADPWEQWNRKVYKFNRALDRKVLLPITHVYLSVAPRFIQTGATNFFENIADIPTMVNNILQGKLKNSASDLSRFAINSTLGIGGLWDIASSFGLEKHREDFGQTLGLWGVPSGPFLMLPLFGPKTLRGLSDYAVYPHYDVLNSTDHLPDRRLLRGLSIIANRADFLKYEDLLRRSPDEYGLVRDMYLQTRKHSVFDGNLPAEIEMCEDEYDVFCEF